MNNQLIINIKNFLVDWDNTSMDDTFGLADYDLWMITAISLLQEVLENENAKV